MNEEAKEVGSQDGPHSGREEVYPHGGGPAREEGGREGGRREE